MSRWLVISLVAACSGASDRAPTTHVVEVASFPATLVRELDLLFQIDDSGSTAHFQISLARDIASLLDSLFPEGDLATLQVGVTTSDLGTSGSLDPDNPADAVGTVGQGGCADQGQDGTMRDPFDLVEGAYVIHDDAGPLTNYQGSLIEVLQVLFRVGSTGCGFEQPFAATRRFVARNPGFVRPGASLAIIFMADEDDCSVRDPAFFDPDEATLGPQQSFRCTTQGITCDEPIADLGPKGNCRPRSDSRYIEDIAITSDYLAGIKPRPDRLTVSAIVGTPEPVVVELRNINGMPIATLAHSCTWNLSTGPAVADPPVRIAALVGHHQSRGALTSVCQDDLRPQLAQIATTIKRSLGIACIETSQLADGLDGPGVQPACEARDVSADGTLTTLLPPCPAAGDCFEIVADPAACPETADHARIVVTRTQPPAEGARVEVYCEAPLPVLVPSMDAGVSQVR